jgi:hypothetical protein
LKVKNTLKSTRKARHSFLVAAAEQPTPAVNTIKNPHVIIPENSTLLRPNIFKTSLLSAYPANTNIKVASIFKLNVMKKEG